jgi:hypothetical protein
MRCGEGFHQGGTKDPTYEGRMAEYKVSFDPTVGVEIIRRATKAALTFNLMASFFLLAGLAPAFLPWPGFGTLQCMALIAWLVVFAGALGLIVHSWLMVYGWDLTWRRPEIKKARKLWAASLTISLVQVASLLGVFAWLLSRFSVSDLG